MLGAIGTRWPLSRIGTVGHSAISSPSPRRLRGNAGITMPPMRKLRALAAQVALLCAKTTAETIFWDGHTEGGDYTVQSGDTLVLRGDNTVSGSLIVAAGGVLTVDDARSTTMHVGNIEVFGTFRIGTIDAPYTKKAHFEMSCGSLFMASDDRRKSIAVRENGTIALFGAKGSTSQTWTKLQDTANTGDTCLRFTIPTGWEVGDQIVLPSTDFDPHQAEQRTIVAIDPLCVHIDRPLQFMHYGRVTEGVDERGEVGLLSRSIAFRGCVETLDNSPDVGGHMIFNTNFRQVQIQGIELENFGQGDQLGRYPLHFHLCGQVPGGTFLKHNSIHDSNFRAIAIHGTQGVTVEGNVAYNITGHAVMLEDGAESGNIMTHNLIALVKEKLTHVRLGSDAQVALSAFYITNPANTISDNIVAGVEGSAYWIHTRLEVKGQSFVTGKYNGIHPFKIPLGDMRRNIAHSVEVGFKIDSPDLDAFDYPQQRYSPPFTYIPDTMPVISDFIVHHSRQGAWLRIFLVVLDRWIVGDVTEGIQVLTRGDTSQQSIENYVTNSLFVGGTANRGNLVESRWQFINYLENRSDSAVDRTESARMAITLYDGPMYITNCTFSRWYSQACLGIINPAIGARMYNAFVMSTSIVAKDVVFEKTDYKFQVTDREADGGKTTSMIDSHGDIAGQPGAILLPDWDFYATPHCVQNAEWGLACPHRYANLDIVSVDANTDPLRFGKMKIYRTVEPSAVPSLTLTGQYIPASQGWLYHPIVSPGASYAIQFLQHTPETLRLVLSNSRTNDVFRIAIVYPEATLITSIVNQDGHTLDQMAGMDDNVCTNCYWFDTINSVLQIVVKERADPAGPDVSCSDDGCTRIEVRATVPTDSGVTDDEFAKVLSSLKPTNDNNAWFHTQFAAETAVLDPADNMDWCDVDDACLHAIDEGNRKMGVLAYYESPCIGVGCYTTSCRYCKLSISSANVPFGPCPFDPSYVPAAKTTSACTQFVSAGDTAIGINVIEDSTCSHHGQGCINDQCRFCRTPLNNGTAYLECSKLLTTPAASMPPSTITPSTPSPTATTALVITSPPALSTPLPTQCLAMVPPGDRSAGIGAIEDESCKYGGLGCFSPTCRYCQTASTPQSSHLLPCSKDAIVKTIVSGTTVSSSTSSDLCWQFAAPGDVSRGLTAVGDPSCSSGGLGCLSTTCRFCSVNRSPESAPYLPCDTITGSASTTTQVTSSASSTVTTNDPCRGLVSSGDVAVGITAVTFTSCGSSGGVGCVTDTCSYCKTRTTQQSAHLRNCTELTTTTTHTTADRILLTSVESSHAVVSSIDKCSHTVSLQENVAGIFGFTDFSCANATDSQVGCFSDSCRYCRTSDAVDIFRDDPDLPAGETVDNFVLCPLYVVSSSMGGNPYQETSTLVCATSVSFGDSQSGISAYFDEACANKSASNGCFAQAPCRYCKYRETRHSTSFPVCPFLNDSAVVSDSTPCDDMPSLLGLPNVSALSEPRCNAASLNLTGCIAYTSCRLCRASENATDAVTAHLPTCASVNSTLSFALNLSTTYDGSRSVSWSVIIQVVVGIACAVAVIAIIAHRRRDSRRREELAIVTPRHFPRPHDGRHVGVARMTSSADYFLI